MGREDEHIAADASGDGQIELVLDQARNGCKDAQAEVLELCRGYLLAIANRDIESGLRPKVAASDAVQETMVNAQRGLAAFRGKSEAELLAWLRTILQNNLKDAQRKYFESEKRKLEREEVFDSNTIEYEDTASALVSNDEEARRLQVALMKLPDDYRHVVHLRNWELKSFEEIGEHLGRSAEAVRKLWVRAIARLQQELGAGHE